MMKTRLRTAFIILLVTAPLYRAANLDAQTTGTIIGRVVDAESGQPLADVEVTIERLARFTVSSEEGRFVLAGIPTGRYTVRVQLLSYRSLTLERVEVRAGRRTTLTLELNATAIGVEPLVVEAERFALIEPEVGESRQIILGRELRELPVDITQRAIELTPGVTDGHFRGGRIGQETYVVDGLAVKNQLEGSSQGLGLEFSPTALEEIEVITGGFGVEYGSALSGVVNYRTRRGDPEEWRARARLLTDRWAPEDLERGFAELSASAGGPVSFIGSGSTLFVDILLQGLLDADPRSKGLTCLRSDQVAPELAAEIEALSGDPSTAHLYCPFTSTMIPTQRGDRLIGFLRLDRPLSRHANLTASLLRNRFQRQLYTPEFKYNPRFQLGQRLGGTLASLSFDWSKDAPGRAYQLTARAAAMRLDRELGVVDADALDDRFDIFGFGFGGLELLGRDFVRQPINEQIRSGRAVPGYIEPGGSTGSPFGPGAEGIFFTEGTPGIANWNRSDLLAGDLVGALLSAQGHILRAGASGRFYRVESYQRAFSYLPGSIPVFARFYPAIVAGFAEARIATTETFTATAGVRVESFRSGLSFSPDRADFLTPTVDTDWKLAVTPRVGFAGAFRNSAGETAFRFNFARVAQPPDFRFFLDTTIGDSLRTDIRRQGNPDLSFEKGRAFEFGVSHLVGPSFGVSITAFRKELTRLVTGSLRFSNLAPGQFSTGDEATVKGIELSVRGRWSGLQLRGGYTLQEATGITSGPFDESEESVESGGQFVEFPLPFDRRHAIDLIALAGSAAGSQDSRWGAALTASGRSGFPLDRADETITRLPWTWLFGLRASLQLGSPRICGCRVRVLADGRNLIGRDNVLALRRDTGGLGPLPEDVLGAADDVPLAAAPIPQESSRYDQLADLNGDGLIVRSELQSARVAAALDRNDPSLFFGEAFQIRLGLEVGF